ncbi:LACCASE [Salix viminalis]|uniref:laccase n=1 Tax=Salix viminalis TaxID=40686 RepID=A0A9Q0TZJ0_SALVM|nr:LACCASE [Salix viminalis]
MEVSNSIFAINIHRCSSFFLGLLLLLASALSLANAKTHYHDFVIEATPPKRQTALLLGEWWNANPIDVVREATRTGGAPNSSDAYTFNGQPGDLYNCSSQDTVIVPIDSGETNLLRVVNSALNQPLFFTVANHQLTVVGADASYVKPFTTSVLMLGPGQTTDVLISGDQSPSRYYMAARAYQSAQNAPFDNTTTTAILEYKSSTCAAKNCSSNKPIMPPLPAYNDTATVTTFTKSFRSTGKNFVPTDIDENLFFTIGLGVWLMHCHLDVHITWGLATAFLVENGVGELQSIESPPEDLPLC